MGKIRVSTLGSEEEKELREKQKVKREEKKKREEAQKIHIAGMKGGERIKAVGAQSEEEIEKLAKLAETVEKDQTEGFALQAHPEGIEVKTEEKAKSKKRAKKRSRSKLYQQAIMKIDHGKQYEITEAVILLREINLTKFDATVETHINTIEKGLRGSVTLPHGTGKQIKVAIADTETIDKIIQSVEKGKIDFDALIAHPQVMGKLAKVARFLGPKGLMPNPKAGTISPEPEKIAEKLKKGEVNWKTEPDFPIIHQIIGKLSFKDEQLIVNFKALVKSIGESKIKSITLKSTMSPGIKIKYN